jgi:hypothetical protein
VRSTRIFALATAVATLLGPVTPGAVIAADGRDHATGDGVLHPSGATYEQTFQFDASSDPDGSNTTGTFRWNEGPWEYSGTIECMTVSGNRAVIGGRITSRPAEVPDYVAQVTVMYVEDNGATGDRFYDTGIGGSQAPGQIVYPNCTLYAYQGYDLDSGSITLVDEAVPYQPAPTPVGTDVFVYPPDATTGSNPVTLAFDSVGTAGATSLTTSATGPVVPSGFSLGDPPTYYDISTTAGFSGGVTVCISYSGFAFPAGQSPSSLRMLHYDNGTWVDITDGVNTEDETVCGRTTSFSPFVIGAQSAPAYPWTGFYSPVDNLPTVNQAKAGSGIPVKFSLGGDLGLAIFTAGSPSSRAISCTTTAPLDAIETTVSAAGGSSLAYDARTGQYTYAWKTDKSWAGTCRQLTLLLADGSTHLANFKFVK